MAVCRGGGGRKHSYCRRRDNAGRDRDFGHRGPRGAISAGARRGYLDFDYSPDICGAAVWHVENRTMFRTFHVVLVSHARRARRGFARVLPGDTESVQSPLRRAAACRLSRLVSRFRRRVSLHHRGRSPVFRPGPLRAQEYICKLDICEGDADIELSGAGSVAHCQSGSGRRGFESVLCHNAAVDAAVGHCDVDRRGHYCEPGPDKRFVHHFQRGDKP